MTKLEVNAIINPLYKELNDEILTLINAYDEINTYLAKGTRNSIKLATLSNGKTVAIKSFKMPNIINRYVYRFFRKPKARRSYLHAEKLINLGFNTPAPVGYVEFTSKTRLKESYYVSELLNCDITYRELLTNQEYPNREEILKQFTEFSFQLHEKGVEFLDHSPGNTLIKKVDDNRYEFYLVDLNRMKFHDHMNFSNRMKNLSHLTTNIQDIEQMANHYANLLGKNSKEVFTKLWLETIKFQFRFYKKKEIKFRLKKYIHNN